MVSANCSIGALRRDWVQRWLPGSIADELTSSRAFGDKDPVVIAGDAGRRLDALGVSWVIGGSIASSVHGEGRSTMDVDMVVSLGRRNLEALHRSFGSDYYVDLDAMHEAVKSTGSFNAVHIASAIKVDFFVAGNDPFERERLKSRLRVEMPGVVLYVDTAEHTILRKLEWYRRGGEVSERQWRDVGAIVRMQGDRLDRTELRRWAAHLGVTDLLARLLDGKVR
jgi:hypothetical protein